MSLAAHWDRQYRQGDPVWDSDRPTSELKRVVLGDRIAPCRAIDLGCGTGSNAVWLARQGFVEAAVDISPSAIERARERAEKAGASVRFLAGDLRDAGRLGGPYDFFVDCGCYGAVQLKDRAGYLDAAARLTRPGARGLVLTGNDREPEDAEGPPVLSEDQLRRDFGRLFEVLRLREFRFDAHKGNGAEYLGWSCLLRRR